MGAISTEMELSSSTLSLIMSAIIFDIVNTYKKHYKTVIDSFCSFVERGFPLFLRKKEGCSLDISCENLITFASMN